MVIDCHYHYYPEKFSIPKTRKEMAGEGIDKIALMGSINEYFNADLKPEELEPLQAMLGQKQFEPALKSVIANFTKTGIIFGGKEYPIYLEPNNAEVFAAAEAAPDLFLAWVLLCPAGKIDPVKELEKWKDHPAFTGVKVHPFYHQYGLDALEPAAARLETLGKPMIFHLGFDQFDGLKKLAARHPRLNIILAHAAFPEFQRAWSAIKETPNLYVDLSSSAYLNETMTKNVVNAVGADKCLYGTDGPFGKEKPDGSFDMGFIKRRIEAIFPEPGIRKKILGDNFAALRR